MEQHSLCRAYFHTINICIIPPTQYNPATTERLQSHTWNEFISTTNFVCLFFARTHSTPAGCNRTYYGNVGLTYDLELHRPKEEQMPYECVLTFSAAGGQQGDIVQVGKYECLCSSRRRRRRVIRPLRCVWHDNSRDYIAQSWRTNTQTGYGYMVNDDHHPPPPLPQPVVLANKVQRHNCTGQPQ